MLMVVLSLLLRRSDDRASARSKRVHCVVQLFPVEGGPIPSELPSNVDATTYYTDAYDRLSQVREWNNQSTTWSDTLYVYTVRNELDRITDGVGNVTDIDTNWLGWRTRLSDPDAGISTYAYDNNGNLTSATDAVAQTIVYNYDALDRQVAQRQTSANGPLIATWSYGTASGTKNRLVNETSYQGGQQYTIDYGSYDARGNPPD